MASGGEQAVDRAADVVGRGLGAGGLAEVGDEAGQGGLERLARGVDPPEAVEVAGVAEGELGGQLGLADAALAGEGVGEGDGLGIGQGLGDVVELVGAVDEVGVAGDGGGGEVVLGQRAFGRAHPVIEKIELAVGLAEPLVQLLIEVVQLLDHEPGVLVDRADLLDRVEVDCPEHSAATLDGLGRQVARPPRQHRVDLPVDPLDRLPPPKLKQLVQQLDDPTTVRGRGAQLGGELLALLRPPDGLDGVEGQTADAGEQDQDEEAGRPSRGRGAAGEKGGDRLEQHVCGDTLAEIHGSPNERLLSHTYILHPEGMLRKADRRAKRELRDSRFSAPGRAGPS